jgi:DNA-binding protein HU-beta
MTKKDADKAVNAVFEAMSKALAGGEKISISGFGTFEVRERAERQGTNPRTGERMTIEATRSVAFKQGKALKESL